MLAISSDRMVLSFMMAGSLPSTIWAARPSAIAVFPTPGSPIRIGLFLVLLIRIWTILFISSSLPITGSILPFSAISLRFVVNLVIFSLKAEFDFSPCLACLLKSLRFFLISSLSTPDRRNMILVKESSSFMMARRTSSSLVVKSLLCLA